MSNQPTNRLMVLELDFSGPFAPNPTTLVFGDSDSSSASSSGPPSSDERSPSRKCSRRHYPYERQFCSKCHVRRRRVSRWYFRH